LTRSAVQPRTPALHDDTSFSPGGHIDISFQQVHDCVPNAPSPMQQMPSGGFVQDGTAFVTDPPWAPHVHVSAEI
jgi:hypothetical protein